MEAKEKAKELVRKFSSKLPYYSEKDNLTKSKQCALIAVDEIIDSSKEYFKDTTYDEFWKEVKQEINKL